MLPDPQADVQEFRETARAWLAQNLERRSGQEERSARGLTHRTIEDIATQRALQKRVYEAGFAGITWPVEYGGQGLTADHEAAFLDESEPYAMPDMGIAGVVTIKVCAEVILRHASEEFKRRHLPKMLSGEEIWVEFFSDSAAGSDLAGVVTTAVRDGDDWILNGEKVWSSGAYYADFGLCLARTNWDVAKHKGLTWFAVATTQAGVTVEPLREITGDIEFCRETFDDARIPDSERIGEEGSGWQVAQTALRFEREASSGSLTTGTKIPRPGPLAPDLVELARRAGRSDDSHARQLIAKAHADDFASRALGERLSRMMAAGHPAGGALISYVKLARGIVEPVHAKAAIEIGGAAAVTWPQGDRLGATFALDYLNSRVTAIAGGTNEIQRNTLGERVLGLPREPNVEQQLTFRESQDRARGLSKGQG
ncbi:MAG: acyl-CoA dehydrogenase [Sphingomonadales bacterium]|nr:acyl-CoA dehydrogenase [Sphingomonadales bacterium]MBU3993401.1 acyl-CoA dehydrogenase family protein [Alphaproteobacteria bacterium]